MVLLTRRGVLEGQAAPFGLMMWKSFKLRRKVGSTLAAETSVALDATAALEVCKTMALELEDPNFRLEDRERHLRAEPCAHVTDAKSVADGVRANKSVMGMGDLRAALDAAQLREALTRLSAQLRWAPGAHQLADVLTKDAADPADTFRGHMRTGRFQLANEERALAMRAEARRLRLERGEQRKREQEALATAALQRKSAEPGAAEQEEAGTPNGEPENER